MIQRNSLSVDDNIYAPPRGLSTLAKEFTAATRIMPSSSNELSPLVSVRTKMLTNKMYFIIPYNYLADVVRLLAERYDTKFNVKLGGFRPRLQTYYVSSHTEEL